MEKNSLKKQYVLKNKPESEKGIWDKIKEGTKKEFEDWYNWNVKERPKPIK